MKAFLISWTTTQLESLKQTVEAYGNSETHSILRTKDTSLSEIVHNLNSDLLIVESTVETQNADIATLALLIANNLNIVVLLLSPNRDAETLVSSMQAGVREVLLSPPNAAELNDALRRYFVRKNLLPLKPLEQAKVIAFMSCKGGSGSTFLATNFADILAKDFGKKTAFLDLDLQCGDAAYYVSPGPNQSDITELTKQIERLDSKLLNSSMLHIGPNFDLLSAPEDPEAGYTITASQFECLLNLVEKNYEIIVIDLDRILSPLTIKAIEMSDVVYLVMENLLPFVRDAKRLVSKFKSLGFDESKIRIVINRYDNNGTIDIAQIEKAVNLKVSHTIRSSFADVARSINTGTPITEINPKNDIVEVLQEMASSYGGNHLQRKRSWIGRFMRNTI